MRFEYIKTFRKNWLFLTILIIGMIPSIFSGYSQYILILLLPIALINKRFNLDVNYLLLLLYGLAYTIPQLVQPDEFPLSNQLFYTFYPLILYISGQYVANRLRDYHQGIFILMLVTFALASWSIISNVSDAISTGQLVNFARRFEDADLIKSATNHNMMLSLAIGGIAAIFITTSDKIEKNCKLWMFAIGALALFSGLHLLNRTSIVIAAICCIVAILFNGVSAKKIIGLIFTIALLYILIQILTSNNSFIADIIEGFDRRERTSTNDAAHAGGRTEAWLGAIEFISSHPLGGDQSMHPKFSFAHNSWLDMGVRSGWIAFLLFLTITVRFLSDFFKYIRQKRYDHFSRGCILIWVTAMLLQFFVEPIQEGIFQSFIFFFLIWGFINKLIQRKVIVHPVIQLQT